MGVQGLWDLLGVTGRRVEVEALGNRRVAVDASIWIVQFIKAMRQSDGSVMANAHLLGMFRRLCKLLFMKVKPVIVFDGAAPVLKRRTLQSRRRQRQKGETQLKKIAERILLNQLRAQAMGISKQPESDKAVQENTSNAPMKKFDFSNPNKRKSDSEPQPEQDVQADQGSHESAEKNTKGKGADQKRSDSDSTTTKNVGQGREPAQKQDRVQKQGSLRGQLLGKGKEMGKQAESQKEEVVVEEEGAMREEEDASEEDDDDSGEEIEGLGKRVAVRLPAGAEYEEMKEQIASLPVLMQYETLQNLKEDRRATNRSVFASVRNSPLAYSQLQIKNYLKTTSINGHIEAVRAKLAGSHVMVTEDGKQVPAKRIISDDSAEFILYQNTAPQPAPALPKPASTLASDRRLEQSDASKLFAGGSVLRTDDGGHILGHTLSMRSISNADEGKGSGDGMGANGSLHEEEDGSEDEEMDTVPVGSDGKQEEGEDEEEELQAALLMSINDGRKREEGNSGGGKDQAVESDGSVEMEEVLKQEADEEEEMEEVSKPDEEDEDELEDVVVVKGEEEQDMFAGVFEVKEEDRKEGEAPAMERHNQSPPQAASRSAEETASAELKEEGRAEEGRVKSKSEKGKLEARGSLDGREDSALTVVDSVHGSAVMQQGKKSAGKGKGKEKKVSQRAQEEVAGRAEMHENERGGHGGIERPRSVKGMLDLSEEEQVQIAISMSLTDRVTQDHGGRSLNDGGGANGGAAERKARAKSELMGGEGTAEQPLRVQSVREQDVQSVMEAEAKERRYPELVHTCALCDDPETDGVLVCCQCGYAGHSWCLYKEGQEAEEEEAVTRGESWRCVGCQPSAPASQPSGSRVSQSRAAEATREQSRQEAEAQEKPSALDLTTVESRKGRRKGQRLGESLEVGEGAGVDGEEDWGGMDVEERVKQALSAGAKKQMNPKQLLNEAGYDYSGGMLVQKRASSSRGTSATASPNPSFAAPPVKPVPKLVKESAAQSAKAKPRSSGGGWVGDEEVKESDRRALAELLEGEKASLTAAKQKLQKATETVTDQMMLEVQELLELFGVPYVLSPTEAEAQCAALETLRLVDGIITDDCDVFLFGGRNVFKNIFSDNKFVEWYMMESIESELCLDRDKLIMLALLLGSDYTEGIRGIGIVNAVETLRAFPTADDLREFRNWVYSVSSYDFALACQDPALLLARRQFAKSHSKVKKNWEVSSEFPSQAVVEAYLKPTVDKSNEAFEWGEPDIEGLEEFCRAKFGWEESYTQQVLRPVLQAHRTRIVQTRVDQYSSFYKRAARIKSARVKKVVFELTRGLATPDMMADEDGLTTEFLEGATSQSGPDEGKKQRGKGGSRKAKVSAEDGGGKKAGGGRKASKKRAGSSKDEPEREEEEGELEEDAEFQAALQLSTAAGPGDKGEGEEEGDAEEEDEEDLEDDDDFQHALQLSVAADTSAEVADASTTSRHRTAEETVDEAAKASSGKGGKRARQASANRTRRREKRQRTGGGEETRFVDESESEERAGTQTAPRVAGGKVDQQREEEEEKEEEEEEWEEGDDFQAALALSRGPATAGGGSGKRGSKADEVEVESDEDELQLALRMSVES